MWENVIGQTRAKDILTSLFKSGRLSHAYIFYGPEGVGKDAAAFEFAKLVNCENTDEAGNACDTCQSCRAVKDLNSPFLKFITALPAGKGDAESDEDPINELDEKDYKVYKEEMQEKLNNPYHKISIPKANNIRIGSIRNIKKNIYLTSYKNKKKVFIISEAEMMNTQSSNALLKVLEEPPANSLLILTTANLNSLLPTIVGRCHKIRFDRLSKEETANYIRTHNTELNENEVAFYAGLADGSISKCESILNSYMLEQRELLIEILSALLTGKYLALGASIESVIAGKDKEKVRQFLMLLIIWFRDLSYAKSAANEGILNIDKLERLERFNANFSVENYKIISLIEDAIKAIDMNITPELILYKLLYNIKPLIQPFKK